MSYSLFAADGTAIATAYFTATEPDGREAIWFGAGETDPNREFIGWADTLANACALITRLRQADRLSGAFGVVLWKVDDVADKYGVSREGAAEYLAAIDSRLETAQVEKGWDIIDYWREELPDGRTPAEKAAWQQAQEE